LPDLAIVPGNEIEVPKELRQFMPDGAEETHLGQKNGAARQYRYGRLHIREYGDRYLVHTDRVDPREDPLGHLVRDAPEVLIGLGCAILGGKKIASVIHKNSNSRNLSAAAGLASAVPLGYAGYSIARAVKERLE